MHMWFLAALPFLPLIVVRAGVALAGVLLLLKNLTTHSVKLPVHPSTLAFGILVAFAGTSLLWAQEAGFAARKFIFLAGMLPAVYLGAELGKKRLFWIGIAWAGIFSAIVAILETVIAAVFGNTISETTIAKIGPFLWGSGGADAVLAFKSFFVEISGAPVMRAFLPFPDPHTAALFWGMTFFIALYSATETRGRMRWALYSALFVLAAAMVLSFSRGGYLAFLTTLMILGFFIRNRIQNKKVIIAGVILLLFVVGIFSPLRDRFFSSFDLTEGSVSGRLLIWDDTVSVFSSYPLLGVGLGNLAARLTPGESFRVPANAHNTYLELAAELGIFGPLLFGGALFWGILALWRVHPLLASALIMFAVHSIFETTLYSPQVFVVLAALLGAAAAHQPLWKPK